MTDISVTRGATEEIPFAFKDPEGDPFPLTGSELVLTMQTKAGVVTKSSSTPGSGFEITDASAGTAMLTLTPAETRSLWSGKVSRWAIERRIGGAETALDNGYFVASVVMNSDA
jgi:hypothetical protein